MNNENMKNKLFIEKKEGLSDSDIGKQSIKNIV